MKMHKMVQFLSHSQGQSVTHGHTDNMSAKFDQEIHNGLVAIVFTSLFPYMSIVTLTFDL